MKKPEEYAFIILIVLIALGFVFYYYQKKPERKCQYAFKAWTLQNNKEDSDGFDRGVQAHFNTNLKTCLMDYVSTNKADGSQVLKVIDIYNNKTLLELDTVSKDGNVAEVLYENDKEVPITFGTGEKEYDKRKVILIQSAN